MLGTDWIRELTKDDPDHVDEIVTWGQRAIGRMNSFWDDGKPREDPSGVQFTFLRKTSQSAEPAVAEG
jgi:hypothetical protein